MLNFSIANSGYGALGNHGADTDGANVHLYLSTGGPGDPAMQGKMDQARAISVGDPLYVTEIGHTTLGTAPSIGTSELAQAKMMLSEILLAYENGAKQTYIYELFDNSIISNDEKEHYFGVFGHTGNPKRAATALHNLTTILTDGDHGGSDAVLPTNVTIQSSAPNMHAMSFEKSGGVYDIAVWIDRPVWNDAQDQDYNNPASSTTDQLRPHGRHGAGLRPAQHPRAGRDLHQRQQHDGRRSATPLHHRGRRRPRRAGKARPAARARSR